MDEMTQAITALSQAIDTIEGATPPAKASMMALRAYQSRQSLQQAPVLSRRGLVERPVMAERGGGAAAGQLYSASTGVGKHGPEVPQNSRRARCASTPQMLRSSHLND